MRNTLRGDNNLVENEMEEEREVRTRVAALIRDHAKSTRLKVADRFATGTRSHGAPKRQINVLADESNGSIGELHVAAADVSAAGGHRRP